MNTHPVNPVYRFLRVVGSLWFAAAILVLLLVTMACATVYESIHTSEQALAVFYQSWWFITLMALLAVNVLVAMVLRFPFSARQVGFVITHTAILVVLAGALISYKLAEEGTVALTEGQSTDQMVVRGQDSLTVLNRLTQAQASIDLDAGGIGGFDVVDHPSVPPVEVEGLKIAVEKYVPDSQVVQQMKNDNPFPRPAVQVAISSTGLDNPQWIFPGRPATISSVGVGLRVAHDDKELKQLLDTSAPTASGGKGRVKVAYKGTVVDRPVDECMGLPIAIGDTGLSFRVLRYLPHATVGSNNKIKNVSDEPINPAIEVEIDGPQGKATRLAFAKFPDFSSMHGAQELADVKVTHVMTETGSAPPSTPVEVVRGPGGDLHVRFADGRGGFTTEPIAIGTPIDTPWQGKRVAVLESLDHARFDQSLKPLAVPRKQRRPGLQVRITSAKSSDTVWLQEHNPMQLTVDGTPFEMLYSAKQAPLGFTVRLDAFRVGHFPGTMRPRSFESRVTILDPAHAGESTQIISMNHPGQYGRFTLFQSSYDMRGGKPMSVLSVSHDPGQIIVFIGYFMMMGGMLVVIATRAKQSKRMQHVAVAGGASRGTNGTNGSVKIDLLHADDRCSGGMPTPGWTAQTVASKRQTETTDTGVKS